MAAQDISVLAELERYGTRYEYASTDEIKIKCPFHADSHPSCNVSISKRLFQCHAGSCGKHGDIVTLLAAIAGVTRALILEELGSRYDLADIKIVEPEAVERWHEAIWHNELLRNELYKRAVTDDDIRERRLGVDANRITI